MGIFSNNSITDKGRLLLADVQAGALFTPTRIVIGAGSLPSTVTTQTIMDVIDPIKSLPINKKKRSNDGKCTFGGAYTNEDITEDFYFRELALYAKAVYRGEDGSIISEGDEILYSYGNAGNTADLMPAYSGSTVVEKQIDLVVWIGNNAKVDLTIESGLYVIHEDFDSHAARHSADGEDPITPEDIGALKKTGDTMTGNFFVARSAFPQVIVRDTAQQRDGFLQYAENGLLFVQNIPSNGNGDNRSIIILGNEGTSDAELLRVAKIVNGTWQTSKVYHENNKPTPADVGALKLLTSKPHGIGFDHVTAELYVNIDGIDYNIPIGVGRNEVYHVGHKPTPAEIGATTRTLLWENDDPAAPFAAQTIDIDWKHSDGSWYDGFEVVFIVDARAVLYGGQPVDVGTTGFIPHCADFDFTVAVRMAVAGSNKYRYVQMYEGAESFKFENVNDGDNAYMIPLYVYGIGGVRV